LRTPFSQTTIGCVHRNTNPADLEAFCGKLVEEFAEGVHAEQRRSA
jgi:hypothetical protein